MGLKRRPKKALTLTRIRLSRILITNNMEIYEINLRCFNAYALEKDYA